MNKTFAEALRSLEKAKESAKHRLTELEKERVEIKATMKSIDAALKAFEKKQPALKQQNRPAPTTEEVSEIAIHILSNDGPQTKKNLFEMIGDRLTVAGKSRAGLALRLQQVLENEQFIQTSQGIRLQSSTDGYSDK